MEALPELAEILSQPLITFLLVLTRLGVMMMAMPGVGSGVPMKIRALLALSISLLIMPLVGSAAPPPVHSLIDLTIAAGREAAIGMLIGMVVRLLVTGLQMAGELASNVGGLQLGNAIDPETNTSMSTLSRLVGMMAIAVVIAVGGHRLMIEALLDSFRAMPPGTVRLEVGMLELAVFEFSAGIAAGIKTAAPIVAALLLSNLVTGLISRTLPQLNLLAIGLPLNAIVLLAVSAFTLGSGAWIFRDELLRGFGHLQELW
jgi:flagellar biosynthetic protein FliR